MDIRRSCSCPAEWTVLAYMGASGNGQACRDEEIIRSLADLKLGSRVNFAYQLGTANRTVRGAVYGGRAGPRVLARWPKVDMARPPALSQFVDWAQETFPSRYTALILKDHGGGVDDPALPPRRAPKGRREEDALPREQARVVPFSILFDVVTGEYLTNRGLRTSIEQTRSGRVDVYGFDACSMGMIEIAHEVRNVASFMVATDFNELSDWKYRSILERLAAAPGMGPRAFSRMIVEVSSQPNAPLAAIELAWMDSIAAAFDKLGAALIDELEAVRGLRVGPAFGTNLDYVSVLDLLTAVGKLVPGLSRKIATVRKRFKRANVAVHPPGGVTLFFPNGPSRFLPKYGSLTFAQRNRWIDFLGWLSVVRVSARRPRRS